MSLREQNVKPGDIIGICTHVQMDMYVPCFAALYAGAVFNPWWDVGPNKGEDFEASLSFAHSIKIDIDI